jgi:hypothetical protein
MPLGHGAIDDRLDARVQAGDIATACQDTNSHNVLPHNKIE